MRDDVHASRFLDCRNYAHATCLWLSRSTKFSYLLEMRLDKMRAHLPDKQISMHLRYLSNYLSLIQLRDSRYAEPDNLASLRFDLDLDRS